MAQVPKNEGFSIAPNEGAAYHGQQYIDPGIKFTTPDFSKAAERFDKFQMQLDETRADAQLTELERIKVDFEKGANGFKNLLGVDAQTPDAEGRGLVQRYDDDLRKAGEKLMDGLTANQQRLFRKKAEAIYLAQYGTAQQHVLEQTKAWQNETYMSRIGLSVEYARINADKTDDVARYHKDLVSSADKLADVMGWSPEYKEMFVKTKLSEMYKNQVLGLLEGADKNPAVASRALGTLNKVAGHMLGADVFALRQQIDAHLKLVQKYKIVDDVSSNARTDKNTLGYQAIVAAEGKNLSDEEYRRLGASHYYGPVLDVVSGGGLHADQLSNKAIVDRSAGEDRKSEWRYGASQMRIADAERIAKKLGLNPQDYLDNRAANMRIGQEYYSEQIVKYRGDVLQATAAFLSSPEKVDAAIEEAKKAGDNNWVSRLDAKTQEKLAQYQKAAERSRHFSAKDAQGRTIDASTTDYIDQAGAAQWKTREEVRAEIKAKYPEAALNPAYLDELVEASMGRIAEQQNSYKQEQYNLAARVNNALFANKGNLDAISREDWLALDPAQRYAFTEKAKKIAANDQSTDMVVFNRIYSNDDLLGKMSMEQLTSLRGSIMGNHWDMLAQKWCTLREGQISAQEKQAMLNSMANKNIFTGDAGKINSTAIDNALKQTLLNDYEELASKPERLAQVISEASIYAARHVQTTGEALHDNPMRLKDIVKEFVDQRISIAGTRQSVMRGQITVKDLPNRGMSDLVTVLDNIDKAIYRANYGRERPGEATEGALNYRLSQVHMAKDLGVNISLDELGLSQPLVKDIVDNYKRANGGREPSRMQIIQMYFDARASGLTLGMQKDEYAELASYLDYTGDDYLDWQLDLGKQKGSNTK